MLAEVWVETRIFVSLFCAPCTQCLPCEPLPAGTWRSRSRRRLHSQRPRPLCLFISTADIATPRRVNSPMLLSQREAQRVTVSGILLLAEVQAQQVTALPDQNEIWRIKSSMWGRQHEQVEIVAAAARPREPAPCPCSAPCCRPARPCSASSCARPPSKPALILAPYLPPYLPRCLLSLPLLTTHCSLSLLTVLSHCCLIYCCIAA